MIDIINLSSWRKCSSSYCLQVLLYYFSLPLPPPILSFQKSLESSDVSDLDMEVTGSNLVCGRVDYAYRLVILVIASFDVIRHIICNVNLWCFFSLQDIRVLAASINVIKWVILVMRCCVLCGRWEHTLKVLLRRFRLLKCQTKCRFEQKMV
jgi:hypothetical protein